MSALHRILVGFLVAAALVLTGPLAVAAEKKSKSPSLIRDAEIEGFLRQLARPLFKAAGLNPKIVRVHVIADGNINAFVANGQRIFIHTGLITQTRTPNEIIGVLAHESGHIAGGHLARLNTELERASTERIVGMLIGAAAVVGGAMAGSKSATRAGTGVLAGSQGTAQRNFLSYQRSMESSADQAALKYLKATRQSAKGMLALFGKLASQNLTALDRADPYLLSHPMPMERIRTLQVQASESPYFGKSDEPGMLLRHDLVKAKLAGFMLPPGRVMQLYPPSNVTMPARYARAIAFFRQGNIRDSLPLIDSLIEELPQSPYFWELKAQAYLENAQPAKGLPAIAKARELLPDNGLLQQLHAQIIIATEQRKLAGQAISLLRLAAVSENENPSLYQDLARAYALKGDIPRAELTTAEYALAIGDRDLAKTKAQAALDYFKVGSPEWVKANDIMTFSSKKKKK